jgi:hypothetical protein
LYERSGADGFSLRGWYAFDGAPLVDAETDTLIWAAESGIIYTKKLNTQYDKAAGTISIDPQDIAKARYRSTFGKNQGIESSAVIVGEYLYAGDNGGTFLIFPEEIPYAQTFFPDSGSGPDPLPGRLRRHRGRNCRQCSGCGNGRTEGPGGPGSGRE